MTPRPKPLPRNLRWGEALGAWADRETADKVYLSGGDDAAWLQEIVDSRAVIWDVAGQPSLDISDLSIAEVQAIAKLRRDRELRLLGELGVMFDAPKTNLFIPDDSKFAPLAQRMVEDSFVQGMIAKAEMGNFVDAAVHATAPGSMKHG